ncbi:hypothetical protein WJX72_000587 [[Myrmecia] bisecta]|uniref:Antifreeze protein n=1 Tax=[Myrmecia] bisecta TaxID=41462 RepID=A0AAW1Q9J1_9CHLO
MAAFRLPLSTAIISPGPSIFSEPWLIAIQDDDAPKPHGALSLAYQIGGTLNPAATATAGAPTGATYAATIGKGTVTAAQGSAAKGYTPAETFDVFYGALCVAMEKCWIATPNFLTLSAADQVNIMVKNCGSIVAPTLAAFVAAATDAQLATVAMSALANAVKVAPLAGPRPGSIAPVGAELCPQAIQQLYTMAGGSAMPATTTTTSPATAATGAAAASTAMPPTVAATRVAPAPAPGPRTPSLFADPNTLLIPASREEAVKASVPLITSSIGTPAGINDLAFAMVNEAAMPESVSAQQGLAYAYCAYINPGALSAAGGAPGNLSATTVSGLGAIGALTIDKVMAAQNGTQPPAKALAKNAKGDQSVDVTNITPSEPLDILLFGIGCALESCIQSFPDTKTPSKLDPNAYYTAVRVRCGYLVQPILGRIFSATATNGTNPYAVAALVRAQDASPDQRVPNLLEDLNKYLALSSTTTAAA